MCFFTVDFSKMVQIGLLAFLYIFLLARWLASAQQFPESVISSDFLQEAFLISPHLTPPSFHVLSSAKPIFGVAKILSFCLYSPVVPPRLLRNCLLFILRAPQCLGPFCHHLIPPAPSTVLNRKVICLCFSVKLIALKKSASILKVSLFGNMVRSLVPLKV